MHSTSASTRHRWDGTRHPAYRHRGLKVAPTSTSRLLRTGQSGRCTMCGNLIEWYEHTGHRPVALHPNELPTSVIPTAVRWHVSSGTAYPASDGTPWCRISHVLLCPGRDAPDPPTPHLAELRRRLALRTRRMIDTRTFTPTQPAASEPQTGGCRPARPVVQLLYGRYLAARPVEDIQCVAQTRTRHRCTHPVLTPGSPAGTWTLMPATAVRGQLALPGSGMAVYDLTHLPYAEQLRWRTQHCPAHAATPAAADLARADWELFDPLQHHQHIHPRLPLTAPASSRRQEQPDLMRTGEE
ncbi:DUF6083 domain-containing protein [Streptomyces sp. IB2014 016-6]|uniref:DUF6083 domain-containing protein n=1 Tax=Streptomyces sp. IB2014 016-6 TaxID=2517818 RepID=UPI001F4FBA8A|nr:DUF6083 domain-containing protein [Streptomyces sp. IB2014 016-6]